MTRFPRRFILIFLAAALALITAAGFGASLAWTRYTASLGPLDLAPSREGSTTPSTREGRLLRPFTLPDGRWRLPATTHDVDPRYLAMLVAYEDGRFYSHDGVDLRALVRAGAQWLMRGHVVSGGSTLPMQVARLIEPRPERTISAKLRQIARALEIEREVGKPGTLDRISRLLRSAATRGCRRRRRRGCLRPGGSVSEPGFVAADAAPSASMRQADARVRM